MHRMSRVRIGGAVGRRNVRQRQDKILFCQTTLKHDINNVHQWQAARKGSRPSKLATYSK